MSRTLIALSVPLALPLMLSACRNQAPTVTEYYKPVLQVSSTMVEFGSLGWGETTDRTFTITNNGGTSLANGMPMCVSAMTLLDTAGVNYTTSYDPSTITCASGSAGDTAGDTSVAASAKGIDTATGHDSGGTDSGSGSDTGGDTGTPTSSDCLVILNPSCEIPVNVHFAPDTPTIGEVYGAMSVETKDQTLDSSATDDEYLAAYHKDPVRLKKLVYLHGTAAHAEGKIEVTPQTVDFGYVNPSDTTDHVEFISIKNIGDGDLNVSGVTMASTCDAAYSLVTNPPAGVLPPGGETLAEVRFAPTDEGAAYCQMSVASDSREAPDVPVTFTGNAGSAPDNSPPTAAIRSPSNGYKYDAIRDLELEVNIFDVDQPATTLTCRVYSAVLQTANVATCTAPDDSGHFFIDIPPGDLSTGTDTLQLIVTDGSGVSATAAVSVVIGTDYPADDDDGDGYGLSDPTNPDCDEHNRNTYPGAAELYDNKDNDCDGVVDEGTDGFDDDGDGFSEAAGDCDDYNDSAYPGAPERGDGVDNDCDGVVDEGTALYDDDGDGYAEVNNDCNDADPTVNPAAVEVCGDHIDNNCNGLIDSGDACVSTDSSPVIAGGLAGVAADQYACEEGDVITLSVLSYDADGQVSTFAWQSDAGPTVFDTTSASSVHFTCPALGTNESGGKAFLAVVTVADPDGHNASASTKIADYPTDSGMYQTYEKVTVPDSGKGSGGGCATVSPVPGLSLFGLALAAAGIRRRRS